MGHILVDLDGTLAQYHGWKGAEYIGDPVPAMLERVKKWLKEGMDVRIFTARASTPEDIPYVIEWCKKHLGQELPVTNQKDYATIEIWDDRAIQVKINTGNPVGNQY